MLIAGIIVICIVLLVLGFLAPRLSRHPQKGVDKVLGTGQSGASMAPGKLGTWLAKPFSTSRKATNKSASKGRQGRGKLPL
ncbi:MAG: hypothetical protein JWP17_2479 [Solirubrobacterales bacterium]|jgi:hypothetical protein|nr:hypothetical protein [Solirubrobacterales bacterium]